MQFEKRLGEPCFRRRPPQDRLMSSVETRIAALDWNRIESDLGDRGYATTGPLLSAAECSGLAAAYEIEARFRSRIVMAKHGFGRGEYKYFKYPLPALVARLRPALYERLAPIMPRRPCVPAGAPGELRLDAKKSEIIPEYPY